MCNQTVCQKSEVVDRASGEFSLVKLIGKWMNSVIVSKRRPLRVSELSPDLLKDIGLGEMSSRADSLDEKWHRELDQLSK